MNMKEAADGLIMTAKHRILISIVFLKKYRYNNLSKSGRKGEISSVCGNKNRNGVL